MQKSSAIIGHFTLALAILLTAVSQSFVDAQESTSVKGLVNHLPSGANMLMLVDVRDIQNSPLAQTEEWEESVRNRYSTGLGQVLRASRLAAVAASINQRWAEPVWRAALMVESDRNAFSELKQAFPGKVDQHIGYEFVETNNDSYVLSPKSGWIAVFSPIERQYFSKWLQHMKQPPNWVDGSYLGRAIKAFAKPEVQVVIGADLRYSYSRIQILEEVRDSDLLKKFEIDPKEFADLGSSIEGFTISTSIDDQIQTSVQLTFSDDISSLKLVARELAFQFLDNAGIHIPEMANWQLSVQKRTVRLNGPMDIDGFRLMVSELDLIDEMPSWATWKGEGTDPAQRTRAYYKTVNLMMDDLRNQLTATVHFASNAKRMQRYADRIRRLPTQFVDDEVIAFADEAVTMLIESATDLQNTNEKNKSDIAGLRSTRSGTSDDYGSMGISRYGNRYGSQRFYRFRGGDTGKYRREAAELENAEEVWTKINLRFEEFEKASFELQRQLEDRYDVEY